MSASGWRRAVLWAGWVPAVVAAAVPRPQTEAALIRVLPALAAGAGVALSAVVVRGLERRDPRRAAAAVVAGLAAAVVGAAVGAQVLDALLAAVALQVAAWGFGVRLRLALGSETGAGLAEAPRGLAEAPFTLALGWAAMLLVATVAGVAGVLVRPLVLLVLLVGWVLAAHAAVPGLVSRTLRPSGSAAAAGGPVSLSWWWLLGLLCLVGWPGALAPETRHDALTAHLPMAREFAARGAIVEMPTNRASYFQVGADVLYALAMVLRPGAALPKLLHYGAGFVTVLLTYRLGARLAGPAAGGLAAAVVAGTPLVWWLQGTAYTDLWLALFVTAMALAALRVVEGAGGGRVAGWAAIAGALGGAALDVKITSVAVVAPLAVVVGWTSLRRRDLPAVAALVAGLIVLGTHSYLRAWMLTGNPTFPLFAHLFPQRLPRIGGVSAARLFGMGDGLADTALLPWRIVRYPERFVEVGWLHAGYLALLPAALVALASVRHARWLAAVAVAAIALWFREAQYLRYLVPVLPLLAALGAAGVAAGAGGASLPRAWAGLTVVVLWAAAGAWITARGPNFPAALVTGRQTRAEYLEAHLSGYRVADYVRRALPPGARIYAAGDDRTYYYERYVLPGSWYGRARLDAFHRAVLRNGSGEAVRRALREATFTHLVVSPSHALLAQIAEVTPSSWLARAKFWDEGPALIYADDDHYLLDLARPPRRAAPLAVAHVVPERAAGVRSAAEGNADDQVVWEAVVRPGRLYGFAAGSRRPTAGAQLDVRWVRADGRDLSPALVRRVPDGRPTQLYAAATAPADAGAVRIRLHAGAGGRSGWTLQVLELR